MLVDWRYFSPGGPSSRYDVSPDGRLLVMILGDAAAASEDSLREINVVLNWFEELKDLVRVP